MPHATISRLALAGVLLLPGLAAADTTINATDKYAYAANTGWVNFAANGTDGVVFGDSYLSGYAWAANFGWIHFGDGSPADGIRYQNDNGTDYGVTHDGLGNLGGLAYAANAGWINFGWAAPADPDRPRVDLATGEFAGYAYGANIGWINLATGLTTDAMDIPDTDNDGLADAWEQTHFGDLTTADGSGNQDGDPQNDAAEYAANTDPEDPASYLRLELLTVEPTLKEASYRITTGPARFLLVEDSTDLSGWDPVRTHDPLPAAGQIDDDTTYPTSTKRFFRVTPLTPLQSP